MCEIRKTPYHYMTLGISREGVDEILDGGMPTDANDQMRVEQIVNKMRDEGWIDEDCRFGDDEMRLFLDKIV